MLPTPSSAPIRTGLIVEDVIATADWLSTLLEEAFDGLQVQVAHTLAAGRRSLADQTPDIALIDLGLPDGSGVDLIRELGRSAPDCRCIVTTIYADDQHLFPALHAGAQGYLLKDQPKPRVLAALQGILAGEPPLSPAIAQRLLRVFAAPITEAEDELSPRERETLTLIAKGCKLPEVSELLGVTRNTASGYIKAVYRKLKVSSRAEATLEAARMGLVRTEL